MDPLTYEKVNNFFKRFKRQSFKKGEILIRADDDPPGIYYLVKGSIKEYAISKKGEELVVNIFKPVSFFPMSYAVNNTPNAYYYEALEESLLWKAPKEAVASFVKNNPDVLYDLISRVFRGIDGLLMRMVYLMSGNAYSRLITEILIYSKRFGKQSINSKVVSCNITEKDLASLSGMTRETISREIKILKQNGLIKFNNGKLIVPSIVALEAELSEDFNALS